jgi:rare lipoprotein A
MTSRHLLAFSLASIALAAPFAASAQRQPPAPPSVSAEAPAPAASGDETGLAAVYSDKLHGRKTASGKIYDRNALTAAHKTLPFGSKVRVTNLKNKRSVVVTINDRGPTQAGRVLDLSPRAAKEIGIGPRAMAEVSVAAAK